MESCTLAYRCSRVYEPTVSARAKLAAAQPLCHFTRRPDQSLGSRVTFTSTSVVGNIPRATICFRGEAIARMTHGGSQTAERAASCHCNSNRIDFRLDRVSEQETDTGVGYCTISYRTSYHALETFHPSDRK